MTLSAGLEPVIAESFIKQRLDDQTELDNVPKHGHAAPQAEDGEPDYPFVLVSQNSVLNDVGAIGGIHIWSPLEYVVRGVDRTNSWDTLLDIAAAIDAALDNASGDVDGGHVWACTRVRPFLLPEVRNGVQFRHLGGVYRLLVKGD